MTYEELIRSTATRAGVSRDVARRVMDEMVGVIRKTLLIGGSIHFPKVLKIETFEQKFAGGGFAAEPDEPVRKRRLTVRAMTEMRTELNTNWRPC